MIAGSPPIKFPLVSPSHGLGFCPADALARLLACLFQTHNEALTREVMHKLVLFVFLPASLLFVFSLSWDFTSQIKAQLLILASDFAF